MASLVLSIAGNAIGGPIGGAIGGMIGSMIDNVLFPAPKPPLPAITSSTYGQAIALLYGPQVPAGGNMIWSSGFRQESSKTAKSNYGKGGKNAPAYDIDLALGVAAGPLEPNWLVKIWANGTLIFDATAATSIPTPDANGVATWTLSNESHQFFDSIVVYPGNFLQQPDPTIEAAKGVGNAPAYRGTAYIVINTMQTMPFGNGVPTFRFEVRAQAQATISGVCLDICTRAGLDPLEVSTSTLRGYIQGYAITGQTDGVSALQPLALCYDFDVAEVAGALRFYPRGSPPICTISNDQLAGHDYGELQPDAFAWPRDPETKLPKIAALIFNDPNRDLNQNTQSSLRNGGSAQSNISTTVPLTLTSVQGAAIADRMLWEAQIGRQQFSAPTDDRLIFVESGRTYAIESPAGYESVRITHRARGVNGVIELEGKRDYSALYFSNAPGSSAPSSSNVLAIGGPVNPPFFIEPPSNFPGVTQPTLIIAVSGGDGATANPAWRGCNAFVSTDDANYVQIGVITGPACMGKLTAPISSFGGSPPDDTHSLFVQTQESDGEPIAQSDSDAEGAMLPYYVGGEYLTAVNVTDTGNFHFTLQRLYRGKWGTSAGAHSTNDPFVRIDNAVFRYALPAAYIGQTLYFRFPGAGETLASAVTYTHAPSGTGYGAGVGGVPTTPAAPAVSAGVLGNTVTWTAPTATDNVSSISIYRATGSSQPFSSATKLTSVGAGSTSYTDVTAAPGVAYTYFVVQDNAVGSSTNSPGVNGTTSTGTVGVAGATFSSREISNQPVSVVIARAPAGYNWTLPATTSSPPGKVDGYVDTAPTANVDFAVLKDGVSLATVRWASGSHTPTLICAADIAFAGPPTGDYLDLKTPADLHGMSGPWGLTIIGTR
jgi:hypothetical protein